MSYFENHTPLSRMDPFSPLLWLSLFFPFQFPSFVNRSLFLSFKSNLLSGFIFIYVYSYLFLYIFPPLIARICSFFFSLAFFFCLFFSLSNVQYLSISFCLLCELVLRLLPNACTCVFAQLHFHTLVCMCECEC